MQCVECNSLMDYQHGVWLCGNCFNVTAGEDMGNDTIIEEGLMLSDVLKPGENQD
ncbi:MAG: hypothetical protein WD533_07990 [Dehalococcoidia bacterium]